MLEGENWELVSSGHKFTEGPAVNDAGELFFTDIPNNHIHKVDAEGKVIHLLDIPEHQEGLLNNIYFIILN